MKPWMSSKCWVAANSITPLYGKIFSALMAADRASCDTVSKRMGISADQTRVLLHPSIKDAAHAAALVNQSLAGSQGVVSPAIRLSQAFPFCAFPFVVTPSVCDDKGNMSQGALMSAMDVLTTLHMCLCQLPRHEGHVSVAMSMQTAEPLKVGSAYIAVTRMDKLGKKLMYTSMALYANSPAEAGSTSNACGEAMTTSDVVTAMQGDSMMGSGAHVKSFVPILMKLPSHK